MGKIFDIESKFMQTALKMSDILIINILTVVCSLPILTIGPAFSAMHYCLLKLHRDEGSGIFKMFFHSFISNLGQGILLTLVYLVYIIILVLDYQFGTRSEGVLRLVLYGLPFLMILGGLSLCWVFPLQSRYKNTVIGTIKTTFAATLAHPIKSLMMTALMVCPFLILLLTNVGVPIIATFGLSLCGYLRVMLYDPVFKKLETSNQTETPNEEAEKADATEDIIEE